MYLLYSLIIVAYGIVIAPRLLYQALRYGKYVGTLPERWGRLPETINPDRTPSIWIHAVSVGEVLSTRALIPGLRKRYPGHPLLLSTTTLTGRAVAESVDGIDGLFYFPFDLRSIVARVLQRTSPALVVLVDTELWPNLLALCARRRVKTILVNGRISNRSHPRYLLARPFFRRVLAHVDWCCAQSEESGRRLIELGAAADRVTVTGNLKFDARPASRVPGMTPVVRHAFRIRSGRAVVMAASTHHGEEPPVLDAFVRIRQRTADALLVLAPRHPERAEEVEALAVGHGLDTVRRSALPVDCEPRAAVVVLDTVGELATLYQVATVVFLGGSLVPAGGHNVIEPAAWGKPIIFGPYMQNFAEIADLFLTNQAARQIESPEALEPALTDLLGDPVRRAALGAAARALVETNRGATDRTLAVIASLLPPAADAPARVVVPFEAR